MKARLFNPFTSALFISGILLFAVFALSSIHTRAAPAEQESVAQQEALQAISLASTEAYTLTLTGPSEGFVNGELNFTVAITPDSHDVYTVEVDFGDGETTEYGIMQGDDEVEATHKYAETDTYQVVATMKSVTETIATSNKLAVEIRTATMELTVVPTTIEPGECVTVTADIAPSFDPKEVDYKNEEIRLNFSNGYTISIVADPINATYTPQSTTVVSQYCGYDTEGNYTIEGEYYSTVYGGKVDTDTAEVTVKKEQDEPITDTIQLALATIEVSATEKVDLSDTTERGEAPIQATFMTTDTENPVWKPGEDDPTKVTFETDFGSFGSLEEEKASVTIERPITYSDNGPTEATTTLYSEVSGTATVTATYEDADGNVVTGNATVEFVRTEKQEDVLEYQYDPTTAQTETETIGTIGDLTIPGDFYTDTVTLKVTEIETDTVTDKPSGIQFLGAFWVELFNEQGLQIEGVFKMALILTYDVDGQFPPYSTRIRTVDGWKALLGTYVEDKPETSLQAMQVTSFLPSTGQYIKTGTIAEVQAGPPIVYLPLIMRLQATQPTTDTNTTTSTLQLHW